MSHTQAEWVQERVNSWFAERPQRPIRDLILACLDEAAGAVPSRETSEPAKPKEAPIDPNTGKPYENLAIAPDGTIVRDW